MLCASIVTGCHRHEKHDYQGYVEGENIYLASPYSGDLSSMLIQRGQQVKKNQLLFTLDPNPQKISLMESSAAVEQAQQVYNDLKKPKRPDELAAIAAQVAQAEAQVNLATLRVKRNQILFDKHVLDKDSLDASIERAHELTALKTQFEANLALAKLGGREDQIKAQLAQISIFKAKMNQAQWQLDQKSLYSPADGIIFDTYYKLGEFVDTARPVLSLLAPENIQVEFFVSAEAVGAMKLNQKIIFNCEGCKPNNFAVIQYISPEAEYTPPLVYSRENIDKLVFRIKAHPAEPLRFKPGQPVVVTVISDE